VNLTFPDKNLILSFLAVLFLILACKTAASQDTTKTRREPAKHSVGKAAIFSAVLPGLGQAYNRKYWKIPVVYAGFGAIGYFVVTNDKQYDTFKEAYLYVANADTTPIDNPYVTKYSKDQLRSSMEYYRRNRDLSIIIGALWYAVVILEAYADAHFFDYDVSEDLTLKVGPAALPSPERPRQPVPGIHITLKF